MTAIKVNADYESVLFLNRSGPQVVNQSLEFVVFFLDNRPLLSTKNYSNKYLDYVEEKTGVRPRIVSSGSYINWWGPLIDLEKEQWLNSKFTSAELIVDQGWCSNTHILKSFDDQKKLNRKMTYLLKNPYGMSGQKFLVVKPGEEIPEGPWVAEPFLNRKFDFSHYVYPDGTVKFYQNLVDEHFQYKGTLLGTTDFLEKVNQEEWNRFQEALKIIIHYYLDKDMPCGFSIDSFVYEENGEYKIRFLSEVNYRRTMGSVALDLAKKYSSDKPFSMLKLGKNLSYKTTGLLLSPGDTRFDIVFSWADKKSELLADSKFSIQI